MCGRFSLGLVYGFSTRFGVPEESGLTPRYNIAPFQQIVVIVRESPNSLRWMRWGLVPRWAKGEEFGLKLINVRAESVLDKPMFKPLLSSQRCLVPATGFYEWSKLGTKKRPFNFRLKGQDFFAMAGIYDVWRKDGKELITCSIITTQANEEVAKVHDRMPVILSRSSEESWLSKGALTESALREIMDPFPANGIESYPVSDAVNDAKADDPDMVVPYNIRQATLF
ncbi:MAG: SOS response-associated peptidase [Methanomassiliicoccales archaeon]|nr:SOS response-associated peptidase [Methanomassiliicoccales archaeon]